MRREDLVRVNEVFDNLGARVDPDSHPTNARPDVEEVTFHFDDQYEHYGQRQPIAVRMTEALRRLGNAQMVFKPEARLGGRRPLFLVVSVSTAEKVMTLRDVSTPRRAPVASARPTIRAKRSWRRRGTPTTEV